MDRRKGFWKPLTSNHTYTPNQYFDVVLPQATLTVARVVGFVIRQTIGWTDKNNMPQRRQLEFTQAELAQVLNLHENSIHNNLRKASQANFIECVSRGCGHRKGAQARRSVYRLKWSSASRYTKDPDEFDGFLPGQGNRTVVPNQYFDEILLTESLAVIKVLGLIVRKTIGWVDNFGNRKIQDAVSYVEFMREMVMSRYAVAQGLRSCLARGYIRVPERGRMKRKGATGSSAIYALFWMGEEHALSDRPGTHKGSATRIRPITKKGNGHKNQTDQRRRRPQESDRYAHRNQTDTATRIRPKNNHKNQTDKIRVFKQKRNKISKQQHVVGPSESSIHSRSGKSLARQEIDQEELRALRARGVPVRQARRILENLHPGQPLLEQLEYVDSVLRKGTIENPVGFLISFLRGNDPLPPDFVSSRKRVIQEVQREEAERMREKLRDRYQTYQCQEVDRYVKEHGLQREYESRIEAKKATYRHYLGARPEEQLTQLATTAVQDEIARDIPGLKSEPEFLEEFEQVSQLRLGMDKSQMRAESSPANL